MGAINANTKFPSGTSDDRKTIGSLVIARNMGWRLDELVAVNVLSGSSFTSPILAKRAKDGGVRILAGGVVTASVRALNEFAAETDSTFHVDVFATIAEGERDRCAPHSGTQEDLQR